MRIRQVMVALVVACTGLWLASDEGARAQHSHGAPGHAIPGSASSAHAGHAGHEPDTRALVQMPAPMRQHTLSNMRDHLLALAQIQEALASGGFDKAADIAEQRLGMSSLRAHGAHEAARHMPQGMQDIGTQMHRSASRFALEAKNASATGDLKASLESLSRVTQACVACHAGYRLQ